MIVIPVSRKMPIAARRMSASLSFIDLADRPAREEDERPRRPSSRRRDTPSSGPSAWLGMRRAMAGVLARG
jgi:hypothetical protein